MARRILIVTAVQAEADAIGKPKGAFVIAGGIGRTNAAAATTAAILSDGPFTWVISAGIAGALPNSGLSLGNTVVASCLRIRRRRLGYTKRFSRHETNGIFIRQL